MSKLDKLIEKWKKKIGEENLEDPNVCENCGLEAHPNMPCEEVGGVNKREIKKKQDEKQKRTKRRDLKKKKRNVK